MHERGDEAELGRISVDLADALAVHVPGWLGRVACERIISAGMTLSTDMAARLEESAADIAGRTEPIMRAIVTADVDAGAGSPLDALRRAGTAMGRLLHDMEIPPPRRDRVAVELFPDDHYEFGPTSFADVDPALQDPGITWGAARAHVHLTRHAGAPVGSASVPDSDSFDQILQSVADVEGWMTDDQAGVLAHFASRLHRGERIVEIGSFRGRSIIVMAKSASRGVRIVAIDPHGGSDRGPQEIAPDQQLGDDDHAVFTANLEAAGVSDRVQHVRKMSGEAHDDVDGTVDLLYIDGAHRFGPARSDIVSWGNRVEPGGIMLIHDSFSSIGVTLALVSTTFIGRRWRYIGRAGSMAKFRRADLAPRDRATNCVLQVAQVPWFLRNVLIKVLITVKLAPLTRLLGHRGSHWPY